ncbi:transcriptional regulator, LysR family [Paraburkholderia fungorum]|uniref:Transcriptional regulator, LysR family n=1 Tax=Paraburkholderia fungorum TaxID=134537 RepID=A0A1H1JY32_9BURK|nr:LysR family transcriptional regulator [Paraburkholderia fungorum]SDR54722.1 transcriptional regulator, LysR family [Paraburkholderia fungorum]
MNSHGIGEADSRKSKRKLPSLHALRCMEAAVREESFTRAAESLHLTHGAVSRAVRLLEEELGVPLFERRNRRVFATAAGRKLAEAVSLGFELVANACEELREASDDTTLTLACEPTLMMRWLIPNLPSLQNFRPQINVHLVAASGPALGSGVDMAIRRNDVEWGTGIEAVKLFEERVGPVCRSDLVNRYFGKRHGLPYTKAAAPILHTRTRESAWDTWSSITRTSLQNTSEETFEHFYFSLQAASAGLGVAIGPWLLVRDEIKSGQLAAPMGFVEDGSTYFLVSRRPFVSSPARTAVRDWLHELASSARD